MAASEGQIKQRLLSVTKRLSLPEDIIRHSIVPFCTEKSLYALSWTCKHFRSQYRDKHSDKKVAAEMLHCVLNPTQPNQARFLQLLSVPRQDLNGPPLYLIRNHGEEVYFNKNRVKKTKTKRWSTNVLEATLRTRNFHLAKSLFNSIPEIEKTEGLKKQIKEIMALGIWGSPELQAAYQNFLTPFDALYAKGNWGELDRLSGVIGLAQKEHLPWFSLYLFCHPVTHANANYSLPPNWVCILWDDTELDLDLFGPGSFWALYKGFGAGGAADGAVWVAAGWARVALGAGAADLAAFQSQCKVLSPEMDKVIQQYGLLLEPEPDKCAGPGLG